jgi:hypothetical protein
MLEIDCRLIWYLKHAFKLLGCILQLTDENDQMRRRVADCRLSSMTIYQQHADYLKGFAGDARFLSVLSRLPSCCGFLLVANCVACCEICN